MLDRFRKEILQNNFFSEQNHLLIAVSGGVDSMVLTTLLKQLNYKISIAHMNFQLRGVESDDDENFVKEWAHRSNIPIFTRKVKLKIAPGISVQMNAREIRYAWFEELMKENCFDFLLTAHHADDQAETILYNLTKGSGISGLRGMLKTNGYHIRPLLLFSKREILHYATENNIDWKQDASNETDKYARNKIRHHVVPILQEINPAFIENLSLTQERLFATESILKDTAIKIVSSFGSLNDENLILDMDWCKNPIVDGVILNEILQPFGFHYSRVKSIVKSYKSNSGIRFLSATHECLVDRNKLIVRKNPEHFETDLLITTSTFEIHLIEGRLIGKSISRKNFNPSYSKSCAYLDAQLISFPLQIRTWKAGDHFQPFGMRNNKNVSDFLIDIKMPVIEKEKQLVLISKGEICWLVNHRIDDRFKITPRTQDILLLEYHPQEID